MRRTLIIIGCVLAVFLALPVGAAYWVIYTESGLRFALARLTHFETVRMQFQGVRGTAAGHLHVDRFVLEQDRVRIVADDISTAISPQALLLQTIAVRNLKVGKSRIEIYPRRKPPSKTPLKLLPSFLRIQVDRTEVGPSEVVLPNGYILTSNRLVSSAVMNSRELKVRNIDLDAAHYTAAGSYGLVASDPIRMSADLDCSLKWPNRAAWRGNLHAKGDLDSMEIRGEQTTPVRAAIAGRLLTVTHGWHWQARLTSESLDFAALAPGLKIAAEKVVLDARGDHEGMAVSGVLTPTNLPTGELTVAARGPYPTLKVVLDEASLRDRAGTKLDGRGSLDFTGGGTQIALKGRATQFRWPMLSPALVEAQGFDFSIAGDQFPYAFDVAGDLQIKALPSITAKAHGSLGRDRVEVQGFAGDWLAGRTSGSGSVRWGEDLGWDASVAATGLDPRAIDAAWPGKVDLRVTGRGTGFESSQDVSLVIDNLRGRLRGQPVSAKAKITRRSGVFRFEDVVASMGDARLTASGTVGAVHDLRVNVSAEHLEHVLPKSEGSLYFAATLRGRAATARLTSRIAGHALKYGQFAAERIDGDADIDLSDSLDSRLNVTITGAQVAGYALGTMTTTLAGRASKHSLDLRGRSGSLLWRSHVEGGYKPPNWRGILDEFDLEDGDDFVWRLSTPAALQAGADLIEVEPFCAAGLSGRICAQGNWHRDGAWAVRGEAHQVPLRALGKELPTQPEYKGMLELDADFKGDAVAPFTGRFTFDLINGTLDYKTTSGRRDTLRLGSGHGEFTAAADRFDSQLYLAATEQSWLRATASARRAPDWLESAVSGNLHMESQELNFVPLLVPEIDRLVGRLTADLELGGTLRSPDFNGRLTLADGQMDLYQVNLLMRGMGARIDVMGPKMSLNAQTQIGSGTAQITGNLLWRDRQPSGLITLRGDKLRMANVPELRVDASPNLNFRIDDRRIDVDGTLLVPYARINPADLTGATLPSGDEVIVGEELVGEEERYQIYTDLRLTLGDDVEIETYGLIGRLTGGVTVSSVPTGVARGAGELKIEEGKYTAYGRKLDIARGRLIFSGGPVSDPAVDIKAEKKFPDVTAGVNVRGKLRSPLISFYSDPSLPQSQIVSILVAGGTIESLQTNSASTQQVGQARNELLAQGGALVAQQIGARLGIEDISIESNAANQTSLVLGKFLNPRLYVSYGVSLAESINTVKLRYTLGDRWTIKTEAGENRSADLVYTIER